MKLNNAEANARKSRSDTTVPAGTRLHGHAERADGAATADEKVRITAFLDDLKARGRKPKTLESYASDWLGHSEWWFEQSQATVPFDVSDMSGESVAAYKAALTEAGMSASTINRKLVFLKVYAGWSMDRGAVEPERHDAIRAVDAAPQKPRRPRGLSDLELRRFLKEVDQRANLRDQAIIYTLLQTGLRVSELVALSREQIGLGPRSGFIRLDDANGRGRTRRVAIGSAARRRLKAWMEARGDHDGPLFTGERGPLTANAIQRLVRKYCAFAKVKASPQALRHTFAAQFLQSNDGDLVGLADVLGHESLDTTRLYVASAREEARVSATPRTHSAPVAITGGRS